MTALTVGTKVQIADPAYCGQFDGYVSPAAFGKLGTVKRDHGNGVFDVTFVKENGETGYQGIHEAYLAPVVIDPIATARTALLDQREVVADQLQRITDAIEALERVPA